MDKRTGLYIVGAALLAVMVPRTGNAQNTEVNGCFWQADTSTWNLLRLDARQAQQVDSLRMHFPRTAAVPQQVTGTSGDRILSKAEEQDPRIHQEKDNTGRVLPSAGSRTSTGERVDGQEHAPTDGGLPGSTVRSTAEVQESFSNESGGTTRPPDQQPPATPPSTRTTDVPATRPVTTTPVAPAPGTRPTTGQQEPATSTQYEVDKALRNVLTAEQWQRWERWCAGR